MFPGFSVTLSASLVYLGFFVLIPLSVVLVRASLGGFSAFARAAFSPRAMAALRFSFVTSLAAAAIATVFGFVVAWVLARQEFPGKRLVDALIDLPLALPTAVAGIALTSIYSKNGWLGAPLEAHGLQVAFAPAGVVLALVFVGFPFVVRAVQPVVLSLDPSLEDAAATLGAGPAGTFFRVLLPQVAPAARAGFAAAFARALGEYGSVVFIAGNLPMKTEIAPLLVMTRLEQYDYGGATALAVVLLVLALFVLVLLHHARPAQRAAAS